MLREILFNNNSNILLGKMLDKSALSQRVIAANIANVGTPGYKSLGVSFDEKLKEVLRPGLQKMIKNNPRHLPDENMLMRIEPEVAMVENDYWNGINNVNIEDEMVELAKNQLDFNIASKLLSDRFTGLRTAIRGRR